MSEIRLKPCPFCGGQAEFLIKRVYSQAAKHDWEFTVHCTGCGVRLPKDDFRVQVSLNGGGEIVLEPDERQKAADMWNRRNDDGMQKL